MALSNWFQTTPIPADAMSGTYDLKLVALSYIIAVLASYVALDLVGRLREETNSKAKLFWLFGGAFAMGAGIWSMHFIGMLAFVMQMPMGYELTWTAASLLVAIFASGFALYILRQKERKRFHLIIGGILIGFGIATMHYMGMQGMTNFVNIHYMPDLFIVSIAIAIFAAEAALWLALKSNEVPAKKQFNLKLISALVMGVAICGMHYTGMAAAVFTPLANANPTEQTIRPDILAIFVAGITGLIISLALTVSSSYKRMVNAVQNEKEFLNAMLDNLEDGIIACDETGLITVFNDALQKKLPFNKGDRLSSILSVMDLHYADTEIKVKPEDFPLCMALNGDRIYAREFTMKFKNGVERHVVIDGQPIINRFGNKLGAVIVIHDVTEIKQTEKIKSEFVSVVSHELRTPLTSIRGSLGLLLSGTMGEFNEKEHKLLDIANKNCERLLLLINDILDVEKIQAGKMKFDLKTINITALIKDAIVINQIYAEKYGVKIELTQADDDVPVYADADRILQVLANLISNAAKFAPVDTVIEIKVLKIHHKVRICVCDKGSGIPFEFQSRIFQKFSQADSSDARSKGGSGLGLTISKAIIEKLGGTINFESAPGEGTTFYFEMPIHDENALDKKPEIKPISENKVLLCDDDEDLARFINVLLEGEGIDSDIAINATEAKKLLASNNYKALILDLILPDQDGISLIRELRKNNRTREIPIIVSSVIKKEGQEILNGDAFLIIDWLEKPINLDNLMHIIKRIKRLQGKNIAHILHVEDDLDTQHIISTLLENEAKITACVNIKQTEQVLGKDKFDLVILDLALPDGKGWELIPLFAKYKLPIIVYSAYDLDHEYAQQVTHALVKSKTTHAQLLNTIKSLLDEATKSETKTENKNLIN